MLALAAGLAILLLQGLHACRLAETRELARAEVERALHDGGPAHGAVLLAAFDRSTQDILFAASGPYLVLLLFVIFWTGHLLGIKQRLVETERELRVLRELMFELRGGKPV